MGKFKIENGVSRINRVKLQASIEELIAADLLTNERMVEQRQELRRKRTAALCLVARC